MTNLEMIILWSVVAGFILNIIAFFYFSWKRNKNTNNLIEELKEKISEKKDENSFVLLQNQLNEILKNNNDLKLSNEQLKSEMTEKIHGEMTKSQKIMTDSVNNQFQESQKLIKDITRELGDVRKTSEQVVGFTEQLKNLQDILQNSKQRGALGEYFLESTIKNILPVDSYEFQYAFKSGEIVDAVIKLPEGIVPVDSKFSLENYNNYISETNKDKKEEYRKIFREDLKKRVMETAKYIKPKEGTMDFAFMFIPSEGIYYDLLTSRLGVGSNDESKVGAVNSKNFLEYAFRDKKVIVVSPTTLHAYLQTVMQGLKALKIEKKAGEIGKRVEDLKKHIEKYATTHEKLGNTISTVVNHYNASSKSLKQISNDTVKITGSGDRIEMEMIEKPKTDLED